MGDVVLSELLRERGLAPPGEPSVDVFLAAISQDDLAELLGLARELRDAGLRVEYALAPQAVGKQLRLADTRGARMAIVVGPDDRARGEVMVKDLRGKGQVAVARGSVRDHVAGWFEALCHPERSEGGIPRYGPLHSVQGDITRRSRWRKRRH